MRRVTVAVAVAAFAVLGGAAPAAAGHDPSDVPRLAGPTRTETAVEVSRHGWDRADAAVVATTRDFPDALAAGPLAARRDAPVLLAEPDRLPAAVAAELVRLGVTRVYVVGGGGAIGAEVVAALLALPDVEQVVRLAGVDRYATAAAVARAIGVDDEVVLASGEVFADALGAASLPGAPPVLLVRPDAVPDATGDALADLAPARATVLGGTAAVSEVVAANVAARGIAVTRISGRTRYETAVAVAEEAQRRGADGPMIVATGATFPDALAVGALTARLRGVLGLTAPAALPSRLDGAVRERAGGPVVLVGGLGAVGAHPHVELAAARAGGPRPLVTVTSPGGFLGVATPLPGDVADEMRGVSWEPGCPVGLDELALLQMPHHDLGAGVRHGEMVVLARVAEDVLDAFARIYDAGFPIERMERIEAYGGDDHASMDANNTSAFNCRPVEGGGAWSEHARGTAIDINPVQNPYWRGGTVLPAAGQPYLDRADVRPGMIVRPGPVVEAFERLGWGWGGDWATLKDWMHVSESGR